MHPTRLPLLLALSLFSFPCFAQNTGITLTNGVDGYLETPYAAAVVPASGLTFEAWITYDDTTLPTGWRYPTICRQNIAPQNEAYFLRINANNTGARTLTWKIVTGTGTAYNCNWTFATGQLNTWTHVAGTYNGTTAALLINGVQVASVTTNGLPIYNRGGTLRIGKGDDSGGPIEVWNGQIDEVRLWPFGRTAAEIQQTMNYQLASIPGLVSTWNLDSHTLDTSGGLHMTATGTVNFTANSLALVSPAVPPAFAFGTSTPGCLGDLHTTIASVPTPGNLDFAAVCARAPANAGTLYAIAFSGLSSPLPAAGIGYWLDPNTSVFGFTTANALGTARVGVGLPAWIQPGFSLAFQFGFIDSCGPQGVTASDAIVAVVQ